MIIRAPSRLHMSLIDLNGSYKRIDGGIGLALKDPQFVLQSEETNEKGYTLEFADSISEDSREECIEKIPKAAEKIAELCDIESGFHFKVLEAYPPHSGLGSGTQISVCTAHLMTETVGQKYTSRELSTMVGRGGTSGIGTFAHDLGGFIVDGGHSLEEKPGFLPSSASKAKPATLIARYDFPEEWDILLALPEVKEHMHDQQEVNVFQTYCPIPKTEVEQVSHLILMNLLPFLLEKDIVNFGWAIKELQKVGFNKLEHSLDASFLPTMEAIDEAGAYGTGISSFGPTLYTVFDKNNKDIVKAAGEIVGEDRVKVVKAQNHGYVLEK
ncbi:beta-ribofuranosylaminobenzene 5'-phosphate synthase MptG [Methanobrevibacter ruminantium M1]|uniref:Beta-ribofuranosylaminobenzene 5'-phosphate synthase n=1 Tax=Methanobrevibacter ruminantium (strain ATCC 35063 / DSM 1093 / JCM 13430 / OCM 146 / M1) TaxID=634498 RepID=D3DYZ0_METRM|nr:beta-ribofuranosylaminobenzene 5'-phosphate synthase [Methanobrevibacter ruminantium]ADC47540.1 beta-ribofuranosylaminobenzene 5'-phosphate synthase MptG [Methanobrevibacter ruminantium M1]